MTYLQGELAYRRVEEEEEEIQRRSSACSQSPPCFLRRDTHASLPPSRLAVIAATSSAFSVNPTMSTPMAPAIRFNSPGGKMLKSDVCSTRQEGR